MVVCNSLFFYFLKPINGYIFDDNGELIRVETLKVDA